ncbi:hypothetical protein HAX54_040095, partial [Datura stramonium]|nr:hypothetical protein [Datura stramonium]
MNLLVFTDYAQEIEELKKRIRKDKDINQQKRARSAGCNDRNTDMNFFNGRSLDRALSTKVVLHGVIRSNSPITDV